MKAQELKDMIKGAPWNKVFDFVKVMNDKADEYGFKPPYAYQKAQYLRRLRTSAHRWRTRAADCSIPRNLRAARPTRGGRT